MKASVKTSGKSLVGMRGIGVGRETGGFGVDFGFTIFLNPVSSIPHFSALR
jgi:hypothetical protein